MATTSHARKINNGVHKTGSKVRTPTRNHGPVIIESSSAVVKGGIARIVNNMTAREDRRVEGIKEARKVRANKTGRIDKNAVIIPNVALQTDVPRTPISDVAAQDQTKLRKQQATSQLMRL